MAIPSSPVHLAVRRSDACLNCDLFRQLSGFCDRQLSRHEDRPAGRSHYRRGLNVCVPGGESSGCVPLYRFQYDCPAFLDDVDCRQSPPGWFLRMDCRSCNPAASSAPPAANRDHRQRSAVGVFCERHHLSGDGAVGA